MQDFINNRRKRIGEENNLEDFVSENLKYQEGVTRDDQLYAFGEILAMVANLRIFN